MQTRLGRTVLLVKDYDDAFEFYQKNFFCEKLHDAVAANGQRYLHIRFNADDRSGIWFLLAEGPDQQSLIGQQTGGQPTLVIYTDDCAALYQHVQLNGSNIIEPLVTMPESIFFHCADLYGNRITVVELTSQQ